MKEIGIDEAKAELFLLLHQVAAGEEIIILEDGKPLARLVPCASLRQDRIPGLDAGLVEIAEDFDAPLPEEILQAFES